MPSVRTISFIDADSGDDAFVGVRVEGEVVGLATSLWSNGDIEVFLGPEEVEALIDALRVAQGMTASGSSKA